MMVFPFMFIQFVINGNLTHATKISNTLEEKMKRYPIDYQIVKTEGSQFLEGILRLARKMSQEEEKLLVVVGGDGTLNHFVHLLDDQDFDFPISYLPAGSGNDFSRSMGLPLDIDEGLRHIFSLREPRPLDYIVAYDHVSDEKHVAVNSIGFGLDGNTNYLMTKPMKKMKKNLGKNAYLLSAVAAYMRQKPFSLRLNLADGSVHHFGESKLVLIANNETFGGGIPIIPNASNEDGVLDILVADGVEHRDIPVILARLLKDQSHLKHPTLKTMTSRSGRLTLLQEERGQKDGELLNKALYDLEFSVKQRLFWI